MKVATKTCLTCSGWIKRKCHNAKLRGKPTPQERPVTKDCKMHSSDKRQLGLDL